MDSPRIVEGEFSARGRKVAIAAARFNDFIVSSLLKGATTSWEERGGAPGDLLIARVPGAFELPVVARKLALQALYRWQLNEGPWQDLVQEFGEAEDMPRADREYFRELVEGVWGARQALDSRLTELMDRPPAQLDPVEHAVLLIGLY